MAGQGWYDLRQYRFNAPEGADIHWSRVVDLPIAGLILILRPILGGILADKWAAAIAPMLPLGVLMIAVAATVRRLVHPLAIWPALVMVPLCTALMNMFRPCRIDHHGWQLAAVAVVMAGLSDPRAARSGLTVGLATAFSLAIGMEMFPYLAVAGAGLVLMWVGSGDDGARLRAYGVSLSVGIIIGYLGFASYANQVPRCDALSPVWLSAMLGAGAVTFGLSSAPAGLRRSWVHRIALAALGGALLAAGFAVAWPQCLSNLEGLSPEAKALWFSNIREVRPIYRQSDATFYAVTGTALAGLAGYVLWGILQWRGARQARWLTIAGMASVAALMLLWQGRAGASAMLLALPGIAALFAILIPWLEAVMPARGQVAAGLATVLALAAYNWGMPGEEKPVASKNKASRANAYCSTIPAHVPLTKLKPGKIFTFVDLSPRLIALTRHSAITGPYHRNDDLIVDVHRAFRADPQGALGIITRHHPDYVMICPDSSESTLYLRANRNGLYARLASGNAPAWLEPITLSGSSPFKIWRFVQEKAEPAQAQLDLRPKSPTSKPIKNNESKPKE
jgi:hypothetical protein